MPANDASAFETAPGHAAVGRVLSTRGLRGELKIEPLTGKADYFTAGRTLWIATTSYEIEASRRQKGLVLLKLSGVDSVEAAEALRGRLLSLPESELAPLADGEYYAHEIVGLEVYDGEGVRLGKVVDLFPTGSNDVYVVDGPRGELLLPAIDDVIIEVDVAGGRMTVSLMDGMLPPTGDD
jgi:16S rRNA processing protein RimM